ncbi:MAG: nuclear transport factor 2 family protein [Actinomycetota bacterium]
MAFTHQELADREAIRDVALRYCRGVDRLDVELMRSAYWPDAVDEHGSFVGNAHRFAEYCMTAHDRWSWTMHSIFNHSIELGDDGASASGEIYNVSTLCRVDTGAIDTWYGRYLDRYERRAGEWRIIHRVCVHHGTASAELPSMDIDASGYRDGGFDRRTPGRPLGP